jgi:hypothetical protein
MLQGYTKLPMLSQVEALRNLSILYDIYRYLYCMPMTQLKRAIKQNGLSTPF